MKDFRYYIARTLPAPQRMAILARACARRCADTPLSYPLDLQHVRSMLVILPEDLLTALYHVENVLALTNRFAQASVTFLCRSEVAEYYHSIAPDASFVEYDPALRYLYSPEFTRHARALARERFDVCVLLERQPDPAMLDLVGRTAARVRAGYSDAAMPPFVNHIVRITESSLCLTSRFGAMARSMGAGGAHRPRVSVGQEAADGVSKLLRDLRVEPSAPLAVLDGVGMIGSFGREWTASAIQAVKSATDAQVCCPSRHGDSEADMQWLATQGTVVLPPLTVPRVTALVSRSRFVVAGNTPLLRLAAVLGKPGIGVVATPVAADCIDPSGTIVRADYDSTPGPHTAAALAAFARSASGAQVSPVRA